MKTKSLKVKHHHVHACLDFKSPTDLHWWLRTSTTAAAAYLVLQSRINATQPQPWLN